MLAPNILKTQISVNITHMTMCGQGTIRQPGCSMLWAGHGTVVKNGTWPGPGCGVPEHLGLPWHRWRVSDGATLGWG